MLQKRDWLGRACRQIHRRQHARLFGWCRAHEGDAERAVHAGLDLVRVVGRLTAPGVPLAARVGIATGLVMIGDLIEQGAKEEAVIGEAPSLAARVQTMAEPGTVVVADVTRDLLRGLFEYRDLGMQRLKGFAKPLRCWRVVAENAAEGRFEALHGTASRRWSGRRKRSTCSWHAGSRPGMARDRSYCFLASQGSASQGSR